MSKGNLIQRGLVKAANAAGGGKTVITIEKKRTDIDYNALLRLVCADMAAKIQAGHPFTAYEVTLSLRNAHPDINIPHVFGVRELVHGVASNLDMPCTYEPTKGGATLFLPDVAPDRMDVLVNTFSDTAQIVDKHGNS